MLPKTSRWTGESSCHCSVVEAMPDATVPTATKTPRPMTSWLAFGFFIAGFPAVVSVLVSTRSSVVVLTAANLLAPCY
jgi:hypothetical protein